MKSKIIAAALALLAGATAHAGVATHGFVLFGDKQTYISHLPIYHAPHDFQSLAQVELSNLPSSNTLAAYAAATAAGQVEFTLASTPIDWSRMHQNSKFQAELYKGHFEKGGTDLGPVIVAIENMIYNEVLNSAAPEENKYIIFGDEGEYFAAHVLDGKPSFDLIMSAAEPHLLSFYGCRAECPPHPQPTKPPLPTIVSFTAEGESQVPAAGDELGSPDSVVVVVKKVIHFETDDLK